jgi:hypothetical protein
MGRLSLLNGSIITDTERRDCELHFLRALLTSAGHDARQLAVLQVSLQHFLSHDESSYERGPLVELLVMASEQRCTDGIMLLLVRQRT